MKAMLAITLFFTLYLSAFGRIGETREQCIERYGKPDSSPSVPSVLSFEKSGLEIYVLFNDAGNADFIAFGKLPDSKGSCDSLSKSEIDVLMESNGEEWIENTPTNPKNSREWQTEDKKRFANLDEFGITLTIKTADCVKRLEENAKEKARKQLQGF